MSTGSSVYLCELGALCGISTVGWPNETYWDHRTPPALTQAGLVLLMCADESLCGTVEPPSMSDDVTAMVMVAVIAVHCVANGQCQGGQHFLQCGCICI
ncbi:MAG: hypothetical protein AAF670_17240 [Planctomycetota bacterium]